MLTHYSILNWLSKLRNYDSILYVILNVFQFLGNICRSPMAEAIFAHMVKEKGLESKVRIPSRFQDYLPINILLICSVCALPRQHSTQLRFLYSPRYLSFSMHQICSCCSFKAFLIIVHLKGNNVGIPRIEITISTNYCYIFPKRVDIASIPNMSRAKKTYINLCQLFLF